jgi:uncharacterized protein DUF6290
MIYLVVGGAFIALLLWATREKVRMTQEKISVSVRLDAEDYNRVRAYAESHQMSLSDYVRKTLVESIPTPHPAAEVMNRAFDVLDAQEPENTLPATHTFSPPPAALPEPAPHPLKRVPKITPMPLPRVPSGPHPCLHLSIVIPAPLVGQCQGMCQHPSQKGRPCHWAPGLAQSCPIFEGKRAIDRRREGLQPRT